MKRTLRRACWQVFFLRPTYTRFNLEWLESLKHKIRQHEESGEKMKDKVKVYSALALLGAGLLAHPTSTNLINPIAVHAEQVNMNDQRGENTYDYASVATPTRSAADSAAGSSAEEHSLVVDEATTNTEPSGSAGVEAIAKVKTSKAQQNDERIAGIYKTNQKIVNLFQVLSGIGVGFFLWVRHLDLPIEKSEPYEE